MNLKELHQLYHKDLNHLYNSNEIDSFFFILIKEYNTISKIDFALNPMVTITDRLINYLEALKELAQEKPIQYILGHTEFYNNIYCVNSNVLIPRPETEELVDWIINSFKNEPLKFIDIGTGSGCIAISLAQHFKTAVVSAIDVSEEAIEIAKKNANNLSTTIDFIKDDILQLKASFTEKFDCIVSNPPYVRDSEKKDMRNNVILYEPNTALYVSDKDPLLFYRAIAKFASRNLKQNGVLFLEINQYLAKQTIDVLKSFDFKSIELKKDIFGVDRMIKASF